MTQLEPKRLHPTKFAQSEMKRNQWDVTPEHGTPVEALLDPAYWAHVSAKLRRGDIITALAEDDSYFAELLVLNVGKLFAKVVLIRRVEITAAQIFNAEVPKGFDIKFRGPKKWSVLRGTEVLKEDMDRPQAEAWLKDHLKAVA
jgi:hypothetical protein